MGRKLIMLTLLLVPFTLSGCVGSKKPSKEQAAKAQKYTKDSAPNDIKKLNKSFDNKVTLLGYKLDTKGPVKPGQQISYTLYWKSEKKLDGGWKLFTHVLDDRHKKILNIDSVGPIRTYSKSKQLLPPSSWRPGKVYVDEQSFQVPKKAKGRHIKIITGIWKGPKRIPIVGGKGRDKDAAVVATLQLKGAHRASRHVPRLRVNKLAKGQTIKIDGKLDEEAWKTAASTGSFVHVGSGKKDPNSKVQGKAKLTWDDANIYFGFEVEDKDLTGGFKSTEKDPKLWTKDTIEIMIDPDGDGDNKDYYEIQVNPQNLVFDSQFDSYNKPKTDPDGPFGHQEWSAKLKSAVTLDGTLDKPDDEDKGYTVEIQLPWSSLNKAKQAPPKLGDTWRMNLYAMQDNGGVAWSPILGKGNFHRASRFGRILWADKDWTPPKTIAGKLDGKNAHPLKASLTKDAIKAKPRSPKTEQVKSSKAVPKASAAPSAAAPSAPKPATTK